MGAAVGMQGMMWGAGMGCRDPIVRSTCGVHVLGCRGPGLTVQGSWPGVQDQERSDKFFCFERPPPQKKIKFICTRTKRYRMK